MRQSGTWRPTEMTRWGATDQKVAGQNTAERAKEVLVRTLQIGTLPPRGGWERHRRSRLSVPAPFAASRHRRCLSPVVPRSCERPNVGTFYRCPLLAILPGCTPRLRRHLCPPRSRADRAGIRSGRMLRKQRSVGGRALPGRRPVRDPPRRRGEVGRGVVRLPPDLRCRVGVPQDWRDEAHRHIDSEFADAALWVEPVPGSREGLKALADTGVRLGIVSNADGMMAQRLALLELCQVGPGIGVEVECVVDSGAVGVMKPDPRIFEAALDLLGLNADQVWYVGDMPAIDVVGARRAGIRPFLMDPLGLHREAGYERVPSLAALAEMITAASAGQSAG